MSERDPDIEKTINEIRKTIGDAQQSSKDQVDVTNEIDRLFLIYQAGGVVDNGKTHDALMVARAAKKLDLHQFRNIANQVKIVGKHFDKKKESSKYQSALWSLSSSKGAGWNLSEPPEFSPDLPRTRATVQTYGYPEGGTSLSVTEGIVSRIEYVAHSAWTHGLRIQIDAAVNPGNSGGPVVQ